MNVTMTVGHIGNGVGVEVEVSDQGGTDDPEAGAGAEVEAGTDKGITTRPQNGRWWTEILAFFGSHGRCDSLLWSAI